MKGQVREAEEWNQDQNMEGEYLDTYGLLLSSWGMWYHPGRKGRQLLSTLQLEVHWGHSIKGTHRVTSLEG